MTTVFLAAAASEASSHPKPLSMGECMRVLQGPQAEGLNATRKQYIAVRPLASATANPAWNAYITPGQPSHWRDRSVRVHIIDGRIYEGKVQSIIPDPNSDVQSFLRVKAFNIQVGDQLINVPSPRIVNIEVMITRVPQDAFAQMFGSRARTQLGAKQYRELLSSDGRKLALLVKSDSFHEQAIVSGRVRVASVRDFKGATHFLVVETARSQTVQVPFEAVLAYADLPPSEVIDYAK